MSSEIKVEEVDVHVKTWKCTPIHITTEDKLKSITDINRTANTSGGEEQTSQSYQKQRAITNI